MIACVEMLQQDNHLAEGTLRMPDEIVTRRAALQTGCASLGGLVLAGLTQRFARATSEQLAPQQPHHTPRAKRVIWLFMAGAPSQLDTFDYKPKMVDWYDRDLPESVLRKGQSSELIGRDLFVHAPAILVFDGGKFVSPVIPGFRYADDYEALIGRFLASARE